MPRISTEVSKAVKAWLFKCAGKEDRSEAQIIRRILEDAMVNDPDTHTLTPKGS